jgi:hypothetical protein
LGRAVLFAAWVVMFMAIPGRVAGHVNRVIGPYTILVVLVEEPYFATNHAGFEFWVHKVQAPVGGLERTLKAEASGHGTTVELAISPLGKNGFYVVDRGSNGVAFDPLGGGAWSLRLVGTINGLKVDQAFSVAFPTYPRIAVAVAPPARSTAPSPPVALFAAAGGVLVFALVGGLLVVRRRRPAWQ